MEDIKIDPKTPISEDGNSLKEVKKRVSYPAKDLKTMIEFVGIVYTNLGYSEYHSNIEIAKQHNLAADSIKYHLSSAQHYGLMELKFGVGYKVTELFKKIHLPFNDAEKRNAIIKSLKSPKVFTQLFNEYEGHVLPPVNGIKNHFVRNFHFREDAAEKSAEVFLNNIKEFNLLDLRGVLITKENKIKDDTSKAKPEVEDKIDIILDKGNEKANIMENKNEASNGDVKLIDIVIPLKSTRNKAHLLIPEEYQEEDLDRIAKFVEALK